MKEIDKLLMISGSEEDKLPSLIEDESSFDFIQDEIENFESDFDKSIEILGETLEISRNSLEELVVLAKDDENPKAYDTVNNFLKTMNQTAKLLLELHEKKQKFKQTSNKKSNEAANVPQVQTVSNTQVNNNVYFGKIDDLEEEFLQSNPDIELLISQNMKKETKQ